MTTTVGFVGLQHSHTEQYLASLEQLPVTVTGVCEPDETIDVALLADSYDLDVPRYRDPARLLDVETPDVVWVALPNRATPNVLQLALERDVSVFAEKSLARTASELEPIVTTAERADAFVSPAYVNRSKPVYRYLSELSSDGFFGEIRGFDGRFIKNSLASRLESDGQPGYLYREADARGGILQWLGCHMIDLFARLLPGRIQAVCAQTSHGVEAVATEDGATVQFETTDGAMGTLQVGYYFRPASHPRGDQTAGPTYEPLQIYGMDGSAIVTPGATGIRLGATSSAWDAAPIQRREFEEPDVPGYGGAGGLAYYREFFECVEGAEPRNVATLEDELRVLRILDAAYESAENRRWVEVPA